MNLTLVTTPKKVQIYDSSMSLLNSVDTQWTYDICFPIQSKESGTYFAYNQDFGKFHKFQVTNSYKIRILEEGCFERNWSTVLPYGSNNDHLITYSNEHGTFKMLDFAEKKMYLHYKGSWKTGWTSFFTIRNQGDDFFFCYKHSNGSFSLCQIVDDSYKEIQSGEWESSYDYIIAFENPTSFVVFCYSSTVGKYAIYNFNGDRFDESETGSLPQGMKTFKKENDVILIEPNNGETITFELVNGNLKEKFKSSNKDFKGITSLSSSLLIPYLTTMSFNVWDSSYRTYKGIEAIAKVIEENDADIIGLQEIGSDAMDALQKVLGKKYTCSYYTGVVTKHKIIKIYNNQKGVHVWGCVIELPNGKHVKVFNSHLTAYPYGPYLLRKYSFDAKQTEKETFDIQGVDIQNGIKNLMYQSENDLPILLFGDHNIPSHLDHSDLVSKDSNYAKERNCKIVPIEWPVSLILKKNGFIDSFRQVHPDVLSNYGFTWSPGYPKGVFEKEEIHDRIDYIYYQNSKDLSFNPFESYTFDEVKELPYPSDHRAVVTKFTLQ